MRGVSEMVAKLQKYVENYPDIVGQAIYAEAQIEMTESKKHCPVLPTDVQLRAMGRSVSKTVVRGALRASGVVGKPERNGKQIKVILSYGNGQVLYAVIQHERVDFFHLIGQAKYLESVLVESKPYMANRIAARIHLDKVTL